MTPQELVAHLAAYAADHDKRAERVKAQSGEGELYCYLAGKAFAYNMAADWLQQSLHDL